MAVGAIISYPLLVFRFVSGSQRQSPVDEIRGISLANASTFLFVSVMLALHQQLPDLTDDLLVRVCWRVRFDTRDACRCSPNRVAVRMVGLPGCVFRGRSGGALGVAQTPESAAPWIASSRSGNRSGCRREMEGVPVCKLESLSRIASSGVRHAIVAAPELSQSEFAEVIERGGDAFPHLILIPDTDYIWKVGSYTRDLMGVLGLQVRNNLLQEDRELPSER